MADTAVVRADVFRETVDASKFGVVQKPLSAWERIYNINAVRKVTILVFLALAWEAYARWLNNPLLFPTFGATIEAFYQGILGGGLEHALRFSFRFQHDAYGRTQLRPARACLCRTHPDPRGVSKHSYRAENRLGIRLAHLDCGRAGVRRIVRIGGARVVHLRKQESTRDTQRVRGPVHGDRHRVARRERHFPYH